MVELENMKHTILGAGGSIGNALAYKLIEKGESLRLVSRSGFSINGAETVKADITRYDETAESVAHSDVIYLCAGLKYDIRVWREEWPKIMRNVIDACKKAGSKLIFFDNVYMYGKVDGKMTETTPINPCSKKGEVRAKIDWMLEEEIVKKNITAIMARAADLYGPWSTRSSVPWIMVFNNLMNGKKAQWLVNDHVPHSYTYTTDCADALYILANDPESFNQVWHMPTTNPAPDGRTFIEMTAKELGVSPKHMVLSKTMVRIGSIFDRTIAEIYEMLYQNQYPYYFDSTKFNTRYAFTPKSYEDGIRETIGFLRK
jgi:nucleoside-diphosphate-sugar epimerase